MVTVVVQDAYHTLLTIIMDGRMIHSTDRTHSQLISIQISGLRQSWVTLRLLLVDTISIKILANSLPRTSLTVTDTALSPMEHHHLLRSLTMTGITILTTVVVISRGITPGEIAMSSVVALGHSVMDIAGVKGRMDRAVTPAEATRVHKEDTVAVTVANCKLTLLRKPIYISGRYPTRRDMMSRHLSKYVNFSLRYHFKYRSSLIEADNVLHGEGTATWEASAERIYAGGSSYLIRCRVS